MYFAVSGKSGSSPNPELPALVQKAEKDDAREKLKAMGAPPEVYDNMAVDPRVVLQQHLKAQQMQAARGDMEMLKQKYKGSKGHIKK